MKTLARSILITGILAIVANSSMIAQTSNSGFEHWYRAKYGRPAPTEQARLNQQVNAASPEATPLPIAVSANVGFEQWYRVKYGRTSPTEQARLEIPHVNAASQKATLPTVAVSANGRQASPRHTLAVDKSQLNTLITTAKTPAEHQRIAQSYRDQAQDYLAQSNEHAAMVAAYKTNPNINAKNQAATIGHCEYFSAKFKDLAVKSQELAQLHEQMAKDAERN
jgi:hypothetical protein